MPSVAVGFQVTFPVSPSPAMRLLREDAAEQGNRKQLCRAEGLRKDGAMLEDRSRG